MSENREVTENGKIDETEKIDIMNLVADFLNPLRKLCPVILILLVVCTDRT